MCIEPRETELVRIEEWDALKDTPGLIEFVKHLWWMFDWGIREYENTIELHTGGWSGNEMIIEALQKNLMFWSLCWQKSERGGHYYFDLSRLIKNKETQ